MKKIASILVVLAALLLAAPFLPLGTSKSNNPCANCHQDGRYMYLDFLEGDPGNTIPTVLKIGETLKVAAVVQVTCSATRNNIMTAISATLASKNGYFSVAAATYSIGALGDGQKATAFWNITPLASGSDNLVITAQGHNNHKNLDFNDTYAPAPSIAVNMGGNIRPKVSPQSPSEGQKVKGTIEITGTATKGTLDITKVQLRVDSGDWMDATGTASWRLGLDTTKLKNGKHTIEVRAFDGTDYSDMVNGTLTVDNAKAKNKVSVPMLDGLMIVALVAILGTLFTIRRKR
jgi:hypothetical protein